MPCEEGEITREEFEDRVKRHADQHVLDPKSVPVPTPRKTWKDWYYKAEELQHYLNQLQPKEFIDDNEAMKVLELHSWEWKVKCGDPDFPKCDRRRGWSRTELLAYKHSFPPD